jgi:N-acetylneuraminic acid mutarotase
VLDGKLYVVGGCADACGTTDGSVYNPATDTWSQIAPYPVPIAWTSCAGLAGKLYCAGGTDANGDNLTDAYVYDPATDTWSTLRDMPTPLWGASYAGADGMLVISSGVTTGSALTNQAVAYNPQTDTWSALPNVDTATYRGAGALGFYKIGGSTSGLSPTTAVEYLPGYAVDSGADVPWLGESSTQLTVRAHQQVTITVTMDARAAQSITRPGDYAAELVFGSSTPYYVAPVAVSLTVNRSPHTP